MGGSLIDMLPPEAQSVLGGAALLVGVVGVIVWASGVRVARLCVAVLVGLVLAGLGAWMLPGMLGVAMATGALVGFAVGALVGAIGFRLLQGVTLAACVGLAVAGGYYRWHVEKVVTPPPPAAVVAAEPGDAGAGGAGAGGVRASDLLVQGKLGEGIGTQPRAGAEVAATEANHVREFAGKLKDRWNAVPATDQRRMLAAGIGSAAVALLLAFGFARQTTWAVSAVLGAVMVQAGAEAAGHVYWPAFEAVFPRTPLWRMVMLGVMAGIGMFLQWWFFWPGKKAKGDQKDGPDSGAAAAMGKAA